MEHLTSKRIGRNFSMYREKEKCPSGSYPSSLDSLNEHIPCAQTYHATNLTHSTSQPVQICTSEIIQSQCFRMYAGIIILR